MTSGTLSELWGFYGEVFRLHAHQLLAWAYEDTRPKLTPDMDEPDITGLLATAMKDRLNYHPDTPDEYLHYCPGDQEPVSPNGQLGNERLRLDITIIRNGIRPRISFIFEAKLLCTGGFPIGKYTGDGGMGDFIECRYGGECPEAAMVGLFRNKDEGYWHSELSRKFDEDSDTTPPRLGILEHLSAISVVAALPIEFQSLHRRRNGTDIRIFHIFLNCG